MQHVSQLYEDIYSSRKYYVETSVVIGLDGDLITEQADRILFGGVGIKVASDNPNTGYREDRLINVKTTKRVFKNNTPEIGCCPCGEIYLEMHMPVTTFERKADVIPYIRLVSEIDGRRSEWIKKGHYFVDTRENTHNDDNLDILTLHGYDSLIKANVEYGEYYGVEEFTITEWTKTSGQNKWTATVTNNAVKNKVVTVEYVGDDSVAFSEHITSVSHTLSSNKVTFIANSSPPSNVFGTFVLRNDDDSTIAFPSDDITVVRDIASKIGASVDEESIVFMQSQTSTRYEIEYPSEYTMIEVLGYIGAMYGGNWVMNDVGDLQLIPLWALPTETNLITTELGYRIVFGGDRIKYID